MLYIFFRVQIRCSIKFNPKKLSQLSLSSYHVKSIIGQKCLQKIVPCEVYIKNISAEVNPSNEFKNLLVFYVAQRQTKKRLYDATSRLRRHTHFYSSIGPRESQLREISEFILHSRVETVQRHSTIVGNIRAKKCVIL